MNSKLPIFKKTFAISQTQYVILQLIFWIQNTFQNCSKSLHSKKLLKTKTHLSPKNNNARCLNFRTRFPRKSIILKLEVDAQTSFHLLFIHKRVYYSSKVFVAPPKCLLDIHLALQKKLSLQNRYSCCFLLFLLIRFVLHFLLLFQPNIDSREDRLRDRFSWRFHFYREKMM